MWDRLGLAFESTWLRADTLLVDADAQRGLRPEKVRAILAGFDEMGLGVFTVSQRTDGRDYIVDGQHRWQAVLQKGLGHRSLFCARVRSLDLEAERHLFRLLNRERLPLSHYETFQSQLASDADVAVSAIHEVLSLHGVRLVAPRRDLGANEVCAIAALRQIDAESPDALQEVIAVIAQGWKDRRGAYRAVYLRAVRQLLRERRSPGRTVAVLSQYPPEALDRLALAKQQRPGEEPLKGYVAVLRDLEAGLSVTAL